MPKYIEVPMPKKELAERFDKMDFEAKSAILKGKLERLISEIQRDLGVQNNKVIEMVSYYTKDADSLAKIGKKTKRGWKVNKQIKTIHNMTEGEVELFEKLLNEKLTEKNFLANVEEKKLDDAEFDDNEVEMNV
jgi:predicted transcriptional regulator